MSENFAESCANFSVPADQLADFYKVTADHLLGLDRKK